MTCPWYSLTVSSDDSKIADKGIFDNTFAVYKNIVGTPWNQSVTVNFTVNPP